MHTKVARERACFIPIGTRRCEGQDGGREGGMKNRGRRLVYVYVCVEAFELLVC